MAAAHASESSASRAPQQNLSFRGKERVWNDPLAPVLALGQKQLRTAAVIGVIGALILHGAPFSRALTSFPELADFSSVVQKVVRDRLRSEVDIDVRPPPPPPPPPPPEPEPQPEPAKAPEPPRPRAASEPPPPPPAPAEAAKVLTANEDPDEPVDLTDQGFVTGTAERSPGGLTANAGTSKQPVRDVNATIGGVPGGTGTKPAPPPPPAKDLSRAALPDTSRSWRDCGFPAEADLEGVNHAVVVLAVTVGPDGRAKSVSVVKDPGYGFGKLARDCAYRKSYVSGLDSSGKPTTRTTAPFPVRFTR